MSFTCALSGESLSNSTDDLVVTPSGRLCRKSLLLSKLAENGGVDPFDEGRPLNTDDLVTLSSNETKTLIPPPRVQTSSLPTLLSQLQNEYDALVLELFDTRKALEETRKELSQALYQNDAAVRVVARLAMERDAAKQELQQWNEESAAESNKEKPAQEEKVSNTEEKEPDAKKRRVEKQEKEDAIPQDHLDLMVETWTALSKQRKQNPKPKAKPELSEYKELDSKSWHKTRSKAGIVACSFHNQVIITAGRDKQIVAYNDQDKTVMYTISSLKSHVTCVDVNKDYVVAGVADGWVRLYQASDGSYVSGAHLMDKKEDDIVHVALHPTGQHLVVCTKKGRVLFLAISEQEISVICKFQQENVEYTCGALHPDGLIYGAGTSSGVIHIWDLKNQALAGTMDSKDGGAAIMALVFSNNGYHIASANDSKALVWDLRKLKILATLEGTLESVQTVAFDSSGKYLAYGGKGGAVVTTVKEWGVTAKLAQDHNVTGIVWGQDFIGTCSDTERPFRFHGVEKDEDDNSMEED